MILIALGANIPFDGAPCAQTLRAALARLEALGVTVPAVSSFYGTPAWPNPSDPPFVNAVAVLQTGLQPVELLSLLHGVETAFGRKRSVSNAPRTLDIDLLDYEGRILSGPLTLPHPRMADRSFVLIPLAEVAPDWRHPVTGRTAAVMAAALPDRDVPEKLA